MLIQPMKKRKFKICQALPRESHVTIETIMVLFFVFDFFVCILPETYE
jgi:anti-sigma factor ChrR (cupin superfamily)